MQFMTCKQIARYFFESDELRILTLRGFLTSWGCFPEDVPGIMVTIATIHLTLGWETAAIAKGGTQAITNSLVSVGKKMGIEYHINSEVQKVLIENGTAKGVKLLDGTEVKAKQLVVSDNASPQLFLRLIGEDKITDVMKRKARVYQFDRGELFWGTVGVHELPNYKAAKDNPDVNITPGPTLHRKTSGSSRTNTSTRFISWAFLPRCLFSPPLTAFGIAAGCLRESNPCMWRSLPVLRGSFPGRNGNR